MESNLLSKKKQQTISQLFKLHKSNLKTSSSTSTKVSMIVKNPNNLNHFQVPENLSMLKSIF